MSGNGWGSYLSDLAFRAKAVALNVTRTELIVLEATNEEAWGPHGSAMSEIAKLAENPDKYNRIMNVLSERLAMHGENWRLCYKALLVLEYLVKHGPVRVADELAHSLSSLERLRDNFEYRDVQGKDQGVNVRQRAGELAALISNPERVRVEREKARHTSGKFKGVASSDMRGYGGGGGGSGGGGGYSSGYGSNMQGFGSGGAGYGNGAGGGGGSGYGDSGIGSSSKYGAANSGNKDYTSSSSSRGLDSTPGGFRSKTAAGTVTGSYQPPSLSSASRQGAGAATGSGSGGGHGDDAEDPFEATRRRIERLKAEGALAAEGAGAREPAPLPPPSGIQLDLGDSKKQQPKKLSDIKINPAVAATFANLGIAPPPSAKSTNRLPGAGASSGSDVSPLPSTSASASGLDLLSLDVPTPAPTSSMPGLVPPPSATSKLQLLPGPGKAASAVTAALPAGESWDAFASAPPAITPAAAPAQPKGPPVRAALDEDLFGALDSGPTGTSGTAVAAAKPAAGGEDMFGAFMAQPSVAPAQSAPKAAFDPFASSAPTASMHSAASRPPAQSAAFDPFAAPSSASRAAALVDPFAALPAPAPAAADALSTLAGVPATPAQHGHSIVKSSGGSNPGAHLVKDPFAELTGL